MVAKKPNPKTAAAKATSATIYTYSKLARSTTTAAEEMLKQAQTLLDAEQNEQLKNQIKKVESAKEALIQAINKFSVTHGMQGNYNYTAQNMPSNSTKQGRAQFQKGYEEAKDDDKNALQSITTQTNALQQACDQLRKTLGMPSELDILKEITSTGNRINTPMAPVSTTSAISLTQVLLEQPEQNSSKQFRS